MSLQDFCNAMPKAELHLHLEGTFEPAHVCKVAERNGLTVPASLTTRTEGYDFHDLSSFLAIYYANMAVLRTQQDFFELAWNYLVKAHSQDVIHVEMFFDPQAHTTRGVPFEHVLEGYHQATLKAEKELGMSALLIMCFLRDMSADSAMETLVQSLPYKDKIIGVGLDSDERDNPPSKFATVFQRAREEGYRLTMHCDIDQKNSIEHIRQALEDIRVDRIDHGTNIVENQKLVEIVRERGIGLTCCPVSNSVVTTDFKGKEILDLLRQGVKTTVNSDDPAYFRAYVSENVVKMLDMKEITKQELLKFQKNAFEISWISEEKRKSFISQLKAFAEKHKVHF